MMVMKKLFLVLFVSLFGVVLATPIVSNVKVTPMSPWGMIVDYTVSGAPDDTAKGCPFEMTMTVGSSTYTAKTISGMTNCVNGAHRVYWNMAGDGCKVNAKSGVVTVWHVLPNYCVIDLSGGTSATSYPITYLDSPPSGGFNTTEYKTKKLVLKRVGAGSFKMQNSSTVTLTKPFYMGLFEVTQKQWQQVTGSNPSHFSGNANPVEQVSYNMIRGSSTGAKWPSSNAVDADSFLGKLRKKTGNFLFDLPTEAQWEYACRAGTTTTFSYGNRENGAYMWYRDNSSNTTHEVGTKLPNMWGFYDMHGNVWEWCLDWYGTLAYGTDPKGSSSGSNRLLRGGCWDYSGSYCILSCRYYFISSRVYSNFGFRLSWTIP